MGAGVTQGGQRRRSRGFSRWASAGEGARKAQPKGERDLGAEMERWWDSDEEGETKLAVRLFSLSASPSICLIRV